MMKRNSHAIRQQQRSPSVTRRRLLLAAGVTLSFVAACSSSDDDDDDPTNGTGTSLFGFVSVEADEEENGVQTELVAGFFQLEDTTLTDRFFNELNTQLNGGDVCFVGDQDEDENVLDLEFDFELGETVSAGETLTFTSPAGTYATLERQTLTSPTVGTLTVYTLPEGGALAGLPPSGLILDIPGDVFPSVSNVAVPDMPMPLTDFSPAIGDPVAASTVFSWTSSGVAGAGVSLGLVSNTESIECLLDDDGTFVLPASITEQLTGTFEGTVRDVDRGAAALASSGNAMLLILVEDGRDE